MKVRKFARRPEHSAVRIAARWLAAFAIIFIILVLPDRLDDMDWPAFARLPLELPVIVLALVAFTGRLRGLLRGIVVAVLSLMLIFKLANIAAYFGFARPFNPLVDALMVPTVLDTLSKGAGMAAAVGAVVAIVAVIALCIGVFVWATRVIAFGVPRIAQLPVASFAFAAALLGFLPPLRTTATWDASLFMRDQAVAMSQSVEDAARFRAQLLEDPFRDLPAEGRLAGLKGNDVLLIFVESYGRSSLDNPAYAPLLRGTLKKFDAALTEMGFNARSAWLTSPTFGGESYLAHSTSMSGLWVDNQQRYVQLLRSARGTLISDFNTAGWRTVTVMPEITMAWPEVDYFKFTQVYTAPNLGYKGQPFDYVTMSDQYALSAFQAHELAPDHAPVMAVIGLVSSHIPWAPLPKLVPWEDVGDGSIFTTARTPETANEIWRDAKRVAEYYALSIDYSLQTLMSFVTTYGRENMLIIIVGDHQPMTFIAGENASHEVPVHIIARDPALLAAFEQGAWTAGMEPGASSPTWPMDALRARILGAYSQQPQQ